MKALAVLANLAVLCLGIGGANAQQLRIASPQRGSWEGAVAELGRQHGIFKKHGLDLKILYTAGGGETLQAVISGAVDIGLSVGTLSVFGAFQKGAPLRILAASSTGSRELFWYVPADSPIKSMREADGRTIAFSTIGSSTHTTVLRFIDEYKLSKAKPIATGDVSATVTQTMTGQVDIGWSVAPFQLTPLQEGKTRPIARASDIEAIRSQTIRVQIANANTLVEKKDAVERFMRAYRETIDWMYSGPEPVQKYVTFSGFAEDVVNLTLKEFIPKESLQTDKVMGIDEIMQDAVRFKYLTRPLGPEQISQLIQIPPGNNQRYK
jgi:NitT/TauT family transport system substrate-binding protein